MSQKISQFTQITTLASGDFFPVVQASGVTNKSIQVGALDERYFIVASGNFAQSTANTALASGNAALTSAALKLPLIGGILTGDLTLNAQSDLRLADSDSSNYVAIQAASVISSNVTFTAPSADGTNGQVLTTNGTGTLSFTTAGGGDIISEGNTSAEVIDTGSDGRFVVTTEGSERARIDSNGRLLVGTSSSEIIHGGQYKIQIKATDDSAGISIHRSQNFAASPYLNFVLSRAGAIVSNNDELGLISFIGHDGTDLNTLAASIRADVDGTPGANDMPGRLVFSTTADGSASPTEAMRINNQQELLVGTATRTANGGKLQISNGITFPATAVACTDANTLDDYEEGTWTPTIIGSTTAGTASYNTQIGFYTKIGNIVNIKMYIFYTGGNGTGNLEFAGLPFTSSSTSSSSGGFYYTYFQNITLTANNFPLAILQPNKSTVELYQSPTGGGGASPIAYDASGEFVISGIYFV